MSGLYPGCSPLEGFSAGIDYEALVKAQTDRIWWNRADSVTLTSGKVSQLNDRFNPAGLVAQQSDPALQPTPTVDSVTAKPALVCGAGNAPNVLVFPNGAFSALLAAEMFIIYRNVEVVTAANGYGGVHRLTSAANEGHYPGPGAPGVLYDNFGKGTRNNVSAPTLLVTQCLQLTSAPTLAQVRRNGSLLIDTDVNTVAFGATNQCILGNAAEPLLYLKGFYFETLLFSRVRTPTETEVINSYAASRYGITFV